VALRKSAGDLSGNEAGAPRLAVFETWDRQRASSR
jgi:hypothetical protein